MNNKKIKNILNELYALDPNFKQYEKDLKKILVELLEIRPEAELDKNFVSRLYEELSSRSAQMRAEEARSFFARVPKLAYAFAGVAVAVLAVVFTVDFNKDVPAVLNSGIKITKTAENYFGPLASADSQNLGEMKSSNLEDGEDVASELRSAMAAPLGMGGGGTGGDAGASGIAIMPPYFGTVYNYVYKGEDFEIAEKMEVLRRAAPSSEAQLGVLKSFNLGILDLNTFPGTSLANFNLSDPSAEGYSIFVNLRDGSINIYAEGVAYFGFDGSTSLTKNDIPSDESLIATANQFLTEHKISISGYGAPEIGQEMKLYIMERENGSMPEYVPEYVNVIYPLIIDGKNVYNSDGGKDGLMVSISLRSKKVYSVWGLTTQVYESSLYAAETDTSKIMDYLKTFGNRWPYFTKEGGSKKVDVTLGDPEMAYTKIWNYSETKRQGEELLVPALVFPIAEGEIENSPYQKIVVPVIKEILEREMKYIEAIPMPMEAKPMDISVDSNSGSPNSTELEIQ